MIFYAHERVALIVDGPNTWACAHRIGLDIDWAKLHEFFAHQALLVGSFYFTKVTADPLDGFEPVRRLLDWLDFNGWQVITRDKDTDVDLAVTVMELADSPIDHFVLATGDSDFVILAEALKRWGKRVTVLSSLKGGGVSEDLRRAADDFLDLESLRDTIARSARTPKEAAHA
jgi:uncharacterized protein (TIGR00288 family)